MNKTIGIMKTLNDSLEKAYWQYKNLVRPLLDNVDIIYDKPCNESFKEKLEAVQDNACLAITGAIRGTSRERLYWELGLLEIFPYISAKTDTAQCFLQCKFYIVNNNTGEKQNWNSLK